MGWRSALLLILAAAVSGSDDKTDRATLRGVKAVCTIVEVSGPTQDEFPITKERLESEMNGRLAAAGVPIDKNATTCLYLNVRPLQAIGRNKLPSIGKNSKGNKPIGLYAVDFSLQFLQTVTLTRDATAKTFAPTWSVANLATVPAEDLAQTARQVTIDLVDRFVEAYQSVNNKP